MILFYALHVRHDTLRSADQLSLCRVSTELHLQKTNISDSNYTSQHASRGPTFWTASPHSVRQAAMMTESDTKEESQGGVWEHGGGRVPDKRGRHGLCTEDTIKPGALSSVWKMGPHFKRDFLSMTAYSTDVEQIALSVAEYSSGASKVLCKFPQNYNAMIGSGVEKHRPLDMVWKKWG